MNRRQLITSALQAGAASVLAPAQASAQPVEVKLASQQPNSCVPDQLIGQAALADYFSEQALQKALGTAKLDKPRDVEVVAFNFPSWHPSPYMEKLFGKGWTEWDTLKNSRGLFPGHSMPHYPLWGYYDEADPEWAAKEVDLASTYGVDAWMIDWYWHDGLQFYHEQLERGLLQSPNRSKIKFAIMWANHDWKNVYPARSPFDAATLLPQTHSIKDFENVANYCAEHYFSQPNYLTIEGAPVFAIFDPGKVVEHLGEGGLKRGLVTLRARAQKLGFQKLHLQVCNNFDPYAARLQALGFDSATIYGTMAWTYGGKPPGSRVPYGVGARDAIALWQQKKAALNIPYFPTCSVGWDDSPRFGESSSVAINRSPDQFERLVRAARHFLSGTAKTKLIYIGAWNEWTEDGVLLPDTYWGYSYLEALCRAVRD
jgi:Glycosyltransferase WbsX